MKKQRNKPATKRKGQTLQAADASMTRRNTLRLLRNGAIALPIIGVAGYFTTQAVEASICELGLTKIGDGIPAVVQVHDPQCILCVTLQHQTRRALRPYADDSQHFLVANIVSTQGEFFARRHGVDNVTLVLLDGAGQQVGVVRGPISNEALRQAIEGHLGAPT